MALLPLPQPPLPDLSALRRLLDRSPRLAVLTGAGCSTESGIPDYRSPRATPRREPMRFMEFKRSAAARQRYWSRAFVGWQAMAAARPNAAHDALAALERAGRLDCLITQNVDRLHQAAGSRRVVELHGALAEVICLDCQAVSPREALQARLAALNPSWQCASATAAPDGDADLDPGAEAFRVAPCEACGGPLKPRVVFFGEQVPPARVEAAFAAVERADALLVAGSSLTVWSGLRFVRRAAERGIPIASVNLGPTRADDLFSVNVQARVGDVLPALP
ncbi:MAG: NAD-dependent protein deacetylase [Myxococcales bacterium]|nr:NAD-dependent protein deacetylase [Myxococcales bacterium]MCB9526369.1 NAD-dependent protein deacetylase [Myxococcales bacterium]